MTQGQIAQLQDLSKCYMTRRDTGALGWLNCWEPSERIGKLQKQWLRRLTHLYRHQIAAVKRNQT